MAAALTTASDLRLLRHLQGVVDFNAQIPRSAPQRGVAQQHQGFEQKKPILAASEFLLTKEVGSKDAWGPARIEARQDQLAEMALKVWAYKA